MDNYLLDILWVRVMEVSLNIQSSISPGIKTTPIVSFYGVLIIYTTGDLLTSSADTLVNTVNCEGYMGKFKIKAI